MPGVLDPLVGKHTTSRQLAVHSSVSSGTQARAVTRLQLRRTHDGVSVAQLLAGFKDAPVLLVALPLGSSG